MNILRKCFAAVALFIFCMDLWGHRSMLQYIYDSNNNDISKNFGKLIGSSCPNDITGVCYGTYGDASQTPIDVPQVFDKIPRCHSEIDLLNKIKGKVESDLHLLGLTIVIQNDLYPPCKLTRGSENPCTGEIERNPGIPCNTYLEDFAESHLEHIVISWPPSGRVEYF